MTEMGHLVVVALMVSLAALKVTCREFIMSPLEALKRSRASDPSELLSQDSSIQYDPSMLPSIPLGQPDSIEVDIPGAPLDPDDFTAPPEHINHDPEPVGQSYFDPIMIAGLWEGDILLNSEHELATLTMGTSKNAIIDGEKRWPNGIIPYVISSSYDKSERGIIAMAMKNFHDSTCIRFVPRSTEKDYIHILKGDGCSSSVGRVGGAQAVSLGPGCIHTGIAMHELMHATGFWHEQSRYDRDSFIRIDYSNIQDGMEYNFQKYDWSTIQNLGVGYDLDSIMHYGSYAFARDRSRKTIIPLYEGHEIGQRNGFSGKDRQKISLLYQCSSTGSGFTPEPIQPTKPIIPDGCTDSHKFCLDWAKQGECHRNPIWMKANCQKSCDQCGLSGCKDYHQYCRDWSSMGECMRNPAYMTMYCMMSCGVCDDSKGSGGGNGGNKDKNKKCKDKNKFCKAWTNQGQCSVNPSYMNLECAKSCDPCCLDAGIYGVDFEGSQEQRIVIYLTPPIKELLFNSSWLKYE